MSKHPRREASTTPASLSTEGARIISPQKVDLTAAVGRLGYADYNHGLNSSLPTTLKHQTSKLQTAGLSQKLRFDEHTEYRPSTSAENPAISNSKQWGEAGKGHHNRPGTEAGSSSRHTLGKRNDFKIKKMHSIYPVQKSGAIIGSPEAEEQAMMPESTKEDREAVEDLERWDNEFRIMSVSKAMESDQKKNDANQMHYTGDQYEVLKTPALNREIINLLDGDDGNMNNVYEKLGKYGTNASSLNKKVRVPQKSLETIMTEHNKRILNEILYQRVSKKLTTRDSNSPRRMDLDYTTKTVSTDTISNFKNLQHTIQMNPRIIEYENLYKKLNERRALPEKVFDFAEDRKRILEAENDYASIEQTLKNQFESVITEIHKKKEILSELRLIVHRNNEDTKTLELEIDDLSKKYETLEYQYNQQREMSRTMNRANNGRNRKIGIKDPVRQVGYVEEYSKVQKQMEEKKDQVRELKEQIASLESETQKCQQKLTTLDREIRDLKFKKQQLRLQMKQLYVKILKNEDHIFQNEASFITVIKNMWKINEEIIEDMFPPFVDKEALAYLIENARLEYELEQLQQMSRVEGMNFQQQGTNKREDVANRFLKTQTSLRAPLSEQLTDIKKRLQTLKRGIVKMKRPVFMKDGGARSRIIRWEELSLETSDFDAPFDSEHFIQEKINKAVLSIKHKLEELKDKEINRIFSYYINKEIEEKNLKNLNKLLISLFGRANAEKIYLKFIRLKQTHDFKISENKTFVFASIKHFTNSVMNDKNKNSANLMLSYASNFRPEKLKSQFELYKEGQEEKKRLEERKKAAEQKVEDNKMEGEFEVNYNYNLNYNYVSNLPLDDVKASFYIPKVPTSPQNAMSGKSSMRDLKMSKSAGSFYKVTFKEGTKETGEDSKMYSMASTINNFNYNQIGMRA